MATGLPLLEARALALRAGGLPQGRLLFEQLGCRVEAGERWVVLGANGAGKSSLLAALAGIFAIAAGSVQFGGRTLAQWSLRDLAGRRAWCPQFWADPFPMTVRQAVQLARHRDAWWHGDEPADDALVDTVLRRLDLAVHASADVRMLSGGERQRVALATALLQGAPLLLLDEPASHLDLAHQHMLVQVLLEHANSGGAVVASLHDLNLAWDLATHLVLLDGRGGAVSGARDDVMTAPRLGATFGAHIHVLEVGGRRRFWSAPEPAGAGQRP